MCRDKDKFFQRMVRSRHLREVRNKAARGQSVAVAEPWEKTVQEFDALSSRMSVEQWGRP